MHFGRIIFFNHKSIGPRWVCRRSYMTMRFRPGMLSSRFADWGLGIALPSTHGGGLLLYIPVWLLVVAAGFPTAVLWWRDRRPKAGRCEVCRYDLTGNVSGVCPECGTVFEQ